MGNARPLSNREEWASGTGDAAVERAVNFTEEAETWIQQAIGGGPRPLTFVRMHGSTSSSVYLVVCGDAGNDARFVLRVLDNPEWLAEEPDLAEHEAAALYEANKAEIHAPRVIDWSAADVGFGAPVVLMSFVEGGIDLVPPDLDAWIAVLARELARIHRHPARDFNWTFRSWVDKAKMPTFEWSRAPAVWRRAFGVLDSGEPAYEPVFIHRDYHPMNVLWSGGEITGVVDWINACRGPASVDVAHCRTNLAGMYGPDAAERFLEAYLSSGGQPFDPYWDLDSLLDTCNPLPSVYSPWQEFGLDNITPRLLCDRMDQHIENALSRVK